MRRRALMFSLLAAPAFAQAWPDRRVRVIAPFPPGGAGAQTEPDGHTLLITSGRPLVINRFLFANLGFDPAITQLCMRAEQPNA